MANWLLDYIEMTEYIPSELREQLTSIRELDLEVNNAMDELELDINKFFSECNDLSQEERQKKFQEFLNKCDFASKAANEKINVANKLHDLVEKSMRLLDQALEKLREDLLEGDKAFIVEDIERRSRELDEQMKLEHENMLHRQAKSTETKQSNNNDHHPKNHKNSNDCLNKQNNVNSHNNNHRQQTPAHNHKNSNNNQSMNSNQTNRHRINSTGGAQTVANKQKKRERKRFNSTMTIFNRNSRSEDESSNQTFLNSPLTQDNLPGMSNLTNPNSNKRLTNDVIIGEKDMSSLTLKAMIIGSKNNRNSTGIRDKSNGNDSISGAKQPILTAIDAAHAVSPNTINSDKLIMFSSNSSNGDNFNNSTINQIYNNDKQNQHLTAKGSLNINANLNSYPYQQNQLSNHLLSTITTTPSTITSSTKLTTTNHNSGERTFAISSKSDQHRANLDHQNPDGPFSSISPLSSRHDPIMIAASQAINATQNMTPGRRTSSLKASYAAVNSGRLQTAPTSQQTTATTTSTTATIFDQASGGITGDVYCKCRGLIQGPNMIGCDNKGCKIEWFHYECVGITTPPDGEWFCDDCKILLAANRSSSSTTTTTTSYINTGIRRFFTSNDNQRISQQQQQHHHQQQQQQIQQQQQQPHNDVQI